MDYQRTFDEQVAVAARLGRGEIDVLANVHIEHWRDGQLFAVRDGHNLVTSAGKAAVAGLINGVISNFFEYVAIGIGAVAAVAGDTTLGIEITTYGGSRASGTTSRSTLNVTDDTANVAKTFTITAGGTFAVTEAGLLDSASTGILLARQVFSALNVIVSDTLAITWKITCA